MHIYLCVRAFAREHARRPARLGVGLELGLVLELVQTPGLRRPAKGAPDGDPQVVWFPESSMWRGLRAARRQPRSAAGVGAPATHPGRGWGCGGPRVGSPLPSRAPAALSAVG